jgi:hypothetical protein
MVKRSHSVLAIQEKNQPLLYSSRRERQFTLQVAS